MFTSREVFMFFLGALIMLISVLLANDIEKQKRRAVLKSSLSDTVRRYKQNK